MNITIPKTALESKAAMGKWLDKVISDESKLATALILFSCLAVQPLQKTLFTAPFTFPICPAQKGVMALTGWLLILATTT